MKKLFVAAVICILSATSVNYSGGYIFPINGKSLTSCFNLPIFNFGKNAETVPPEERKTSFLDTNLEIIYAICRTAVNLYMDNLHPFIIHGYELFVQHLPELNITEYLPFLQKEEKKKADSRLYFLFIVTSLGIYLILYVYFSRKLYYYYKNIVRQQYLNYVKRVFDKKDKE